MGMFAKILSAIKILGKGKAMLEAIDDDTDLDGKPEIDELREKYLIAKEQGIALFGTCKDFCAIAAGLISLVATAGEGK